MGPPMALGDPFAGAGGNPLPLQLVQQHTVMTLAPHNAPVPITSTPERQYLRQENDALRQEVHQTREFADLEFVAQRKRLYEEARNALSEQRLEFEKATADYEAVARKVATEESAAAVQNVQGTNRIRMNVAEQQYLQKAKEVQHLRDILREAETQLAAKDAAEQQAVALQRSAESRLLQTEAQAKAHVDTVQRNLAEELGRAANAASSKDAATQQVVAIGQHFGATA